MDDLDKIPDQEVLDRLGRRRGRLTSVYLGAYLAAPLVALLAWRPLGLFPAAALGLGVLLGGVLIVFLVARRLTASRLDLLAFERGLHVRLSPEALKRLTVDRLKEGSRRVLHLQGVALPRGGMVSVVLRFGDTGAELETRTTSFRTPGVRLRKSSLPAEQVRGLRERVEAEFEALRSADRFPIRDGFPCELVIGLRDPLRVRRFVCNLSDPNGDLPIVRLCRDLYSLASPFLDTARDQRSDPPLNL